MTKVKNQRIYWLDNLKLFLMIFVVFGHVKNLCNIDVFGMKIASEFWVAWDMPAFVFLSGYMSFKSLSLIDTKESLLKYLKKIFLRMGLPLIVAIFVLRIITLGTVGSPNHFWFVDFILLSLLIISCLLFVFRQNVWLACILYVALSCVINRWYMSDMSWYFVLGLLFKKYDILDKYILSRVKYTGLIMVFIALASTIVFLLFTHSYKFYFNTFCDLNSQGIGYVYILRIIVAIGFTLFLIYVFQKIGGGNYGKPTFYGSKTLPIYLYHEVSLLGLLEPYIKFNFTSTTIIWLTDIGLTILSFLFCFFVIEVCRHNKITRMMFLGEK